MGVGTPANILEAIERGVDMFDCVMPSRNARHGHLFTSAGIININNKKYEKDDLPIDPECNCPTCQKHSRAYIRHLFKAQEMLAMRLCVLHNLNFYNRLMENIRKAIEEIGGTMPEDLPTPEKSLKQLEKENKNESKNPTLLNN